MKPHSLILLSSLMLPIAGRASEVIYHTGFEAPAFTPGLPIRGQDNWEMFSDGEAISVSTLNANTGAQCLRFDGALLEQTGPNAAPAYCFSYALEAVASNPPPIVEISASVRLDGPRTGTLGTPEQDLLSANLIAVVSTPAGAPSPSAGFSFPPPAKSGPTARRRNTTTNIPSLTPSARTAR